MSGKTDIAKGRIKEAAGALTDNRRLRKEGRTDQVIGQAKETIRKDVQAIKKVAQRSIDKL